MYLSASGQVGEPGPQRKSFNSKVLFLKSSYKGFQNHFERFSVLCISFGDHTLWKEAIGWSYENTKKLWKNLFDSGRCLRKWIGSLNKVLRTGSCFWGFDFWGRMGSKFEYNQKMLSVRTT